MSGPVLVFMPDRGVGDLMWHLPTIRALARRAPGGKVLLATRPTTRAKDILSEEPSVGEIAYLTYHSGAFKRLAEARDVWRLCRRARPAEVWVLEKTWPGAFGAWAAGVPVRRGFGMGHGQERWLSPGPRLPKSLRPAHRIDKLVALEGLYGLDAPTREPGLAVSPALRQAMRQRFAACPRPWIVMGVGGSEESRRWPIPRYGEFAAGLSGGTTFWLGGPEDSPAVDAARAGLASAVNVCDLKLDAGAALIVEGDLFIGNDSGPLNLAASVGMRSIGLYGPLPPPVFSRWLSPVRSSTAFVRDIEPAQVWEAVRTVAPDLGIV